MADAKDALLEVVQQVFDASLDEMRGAALTSQSVGSLAFAAAAIRQHAAKAWRLVLQTNDKQLFQIKTSQNEVRFYAPKLSEILADVVSQFDQNDMHLRRIKSCFPSNHEFISAVTVAFLQLFMSHEFFHIDQKLGSDQYQDSDYYPKAVSAVDYQADVVSIWYTALHSAPLSPLCAQDRLVLLMCIHIFTMNAMSHPEREATLARDVFERLVLWHFHAARILRSETPPNLAHPSIVSPATVSFPRIDRVLSDEVTTALLAEVEAGPTPVRLDVVVTLADGRGLLRLHRLTSGDASRDCKLARAILLGDFPAARDHWEEFFQEHGPALSFAPANAVAHALEMAITAGEQLLDAAGRGPLHLDESPVSEFFDRAERLILGHPKLKGDGTGEYRRRWKNGFQQDVEAFLAERVGDDWRTHEAAQRVSDELRAEIRRVTIRLRSSLDILLDAGAG